MISHSHAVVSEYFPAVHLIFLLIFVPQNDTSKTFWEPELANSIWFDYIKMCLKAHRSNFGLTFAIAKLELFCWNQQLVHILLVSREGLIVDRKIHSW